MKLFFLGDSPANPTGFGRVAARLLERFSKKFDEINVWGIGHHGWPHTLPYRIFPASGSNASWVSNLGQFVETLKVMGADHVFILQDPWHFSPEIIKKIQEVAPVTFYCPVDGEYPKQAFYGLTEPKNVVSYTEYGARAIERAIGRKCDVIPHGVDSDNMFPVTYNDRMAWRESVFNGWVKPDDRLILYVGQHQKRKAWWTVLQIFAELLQSHSLTNIKLVMHTQEVDRFEATGIPMVASQMGITPDTLMVPTHWFNKVGVPLLSDAGLNKLYNCADIFITCSLGEGWGLPITEAIAAGMSQIFVPDHSACAEIAEMSNKIGNPGQVIKMRLADEKIILPNDNCIPRRMVDVPCAAAELRSSIECDLHVSQMMTPAMRKWLSWDRIAGEFLSIMER